MYDYLLRFPSRPDAVRDSAMQRDALADLFAMDHVVSDVRTWQANKDRQDGRDELGEVLVRHDYDQGYALLVSLPDLVPELRYHPATILVVERERANARAANAVIMTTLPPGHLRQLRFEPVPAGADYPWGNWR